MTVIDALLALLSALLSLLFAGLVLEQWWRRRRSFQLAWAAGLLWYAISSGTQFLGAALGWNTGLYRAWYLFGAVLVAAYLGVGTLYLLARTGFGYVAGVSIAVGGLFAYLSQLRLIHEGIPTAWSNVYLVMDIGLVTGAAVIAATAWRRQLAPHLAMAVLGAASLLVAALALTASVPAPGYALDPATHVPVGTAMPGYMRILTGPFNIAGALCLVLGALFSTYVYMPKRKVLRGTLPVPVLAQLSRVVAVVVNLVASLPLALRALTAGQLSSRVPATALIALGGFIPSITSGLDRFGVTWSLALGEFLGVLLIFSGFLVSEEVFRDLPLGLRARAPAVVSAHRPHPGEAP